VIENDEIILDMHDIVKSYIMGEETQIILKGINFSVKRGEFVSILGPSGSGKTTMMNIIGCLDTPTSGEIYLSGQKISEMNEKKLSQIRNKEIGFVFQQFQLLPRLNAEQNVELPLIYAKFPHKERRKIASEVLDKVGLEDKKKHFPRQLSGGQQQRVAIARALATNPTILLADEPTGALDQTTGHQVIDLFKELNSEGHTIIMITHDENIAKEASRIVHILDGNLTEDKDMPKPIKAPVMERPLKIRKDANPTISNDLPQS